MMLVMEMQVVLAPPRSEPLMGSADEENLIDTTDIDIRLPMLVYVSREKRPGYDHNKKAGAMNAMVRTSAIMSNGAFILNLDCDHYIYNSKALREAMCFFMDRGGDRICYVQFPQRFEGVDPNDRYANHNTVFFDVNMRALDGLQGPFYVGTGCVFRRTALYGLDPPQHTEHPGCWDYLCCRGKKKSKILKQEVKATDFIGGTSDEEDNIESMLLPKRYGDSTSFAASIPVAQKQGCPLSDTGVLNGRPAGALTVAREPLDASIVAEAINVISCTYEEKTEWGKRVGWIYGSVTEDVVTGFRMHNRGWRSIYCVTKLDAFRGTAPINLTDRLHQVRMFLLLSCLDAQFDGHVRVNPLQSLKIILIIKGVSIEGSKMLHMTSTYHESCGKKSRQTMHHNSDVFAHAKHTNNCCPVN